MVRTRLPMGATFEDNAGVRDATINPPFETHQ
jgi:hypothetical protein